MTEEFLSLSAEETSKYARRFAASLKPGDMVSLCGELGAGKTEFMRGITEFFNCDDQLSSPTFPLLNIYEGSLDGEPVVLHHFDLYRINSLQELEGIGFDEYLSNGYLSVVEWADRFPEYNLLYTVTVTLEYAGSDSRRIVVKRES
ncbi:MAG: tRNA (adenosine(37)-N6)-threonylcarbamoyltransferase complex ATPase subunit type 1 TsaE [Chlorobiaceae bacterium]|jgi:tRNA threonylcarbamoyladenosine biosynthesis protein TsaE|nr:tRNA (adenosine(37)-N6)-threonylcarbamoyltransferase complex ATPase subunit type 1 TsaE [Chlorobiaceae bacterium]NTV16537.1 tRNA (adenosine(37)-N6)-threonylcarbamoyltransferase complex ATPase subunit type 1 TsaE [Chlorobiaceae bacterium]